jgi:hypothetical protein
VEKPRKYCRSQSVDEQKVGERCVLYHRESGKAIVLNPTGSLIWTLLTSLTTPSDLAQQLQAKFPSLESQQALFDVSTFINDLQMHDLVLVEE